MLNMLRVAQLRRSSLSSPIVDLAGRDDAGQREDDGDRQREGPCDPAPDRAAGAAVR
ncbi:hypothetical protein [Actinoplanes sp. NPDC051851]|uniref:hypothetical protein n=1 Tax=Actinoplanes sp. NPDC051851 TaxID=3154753 RepID=UPI003412ABD2